MAEREAKMGGLGWTEYGMAAGFVAVGVAIAFGFAEFANLELPALGLVAAGVALGGAAWFSYLTKRNS